jgi:hypothetical protein
LAAPGQCGADFAGDGAEGGAEGIAGSNQ